MVLELLFKLCSHDYNLYLSLAHNNLFITQHSHGEEEEEKQSKMNSVLSHPFSFVPSQVTQTPHWLSEAAVHCTPSSVLSELEEFLEVCHLSFIQWKEVQLFFAPEGVIHWIFLMFVWVFFWTRGFWGYFSDKQISVQRGTPAKSIKYHL